MADAHAAARARVRQALDPHRELASVFDLCLASFRQRELTVVARGSLAAGRVDALSDLDFAVLAAAPDEVAELQAWVRGTVFSCGRLLAHFPASHIGLDDLLIFFLEVGPWIVKVDVEATAVERWHSSAGDVVLWDPQARYPSPAPPAAGAPQSAPNLPDVGLAGRRLCGWLWYTFTKIERGELFEAANSLEVMRKLALLPLVLHLEQLPQEDFRRLEARLPSAAVAELRSTYPAEFERPAFHRALLNLGQAFLARAAAGALPAEEIEALRTMLGTIGQLAGR